MATRLSRSGGGVEQPDEPQPEGQEEPKKKERRQGVSPAPFSENVLRFIANSGLLPHVGTLLDPFAGIGKVHQLASATLKTVGVEIEPEWAALHPSTMVGNALALDFADESFEAVVTSPVYGNRMSDSHNAQDGSLRRSYTHDLRRLTGDPERQLHPDNAGTLYAWNADYWRFHVRAWAEVRRVLKPKGVFLLNVSDCIRNGKRVPVVTTHALVCSKLDFELLGKHPIGTPRLRYGENHQARVTAEYVLELRKS